MTFQIFRISTIFLIFFGKEIVFSVKFYVDYICLNIFLSYYFGFYMIIKKLVQKIRGKCQNSEILRKPPDSILRTEIWQKFIFSHNKYVCKIVSELEYPTWRRLYIWRKITLLLFLVLKLCQSAINRYQLLSLVSVRAIAVLTKGKIVFSFHIFSG